MQNTLPRLRCRTRFHASDAEHASTIQTKRTEKELKKKKKKKRIFLNNLNDLT